MSSLLLRKQPVYFAPKVSSSTHLLAFIHPRYEEQKWLSEMHCQLMHCNYITKQNVLYLIQGMVGLSKLFEDDKLVYSRMRSFASIESCFEVPFVLRRKSRKKRSIDWWMSLLSSHPTSGKSVGLPNISWHHHRMVTTWSKALLL